MIKQIRDEQSHDVDVCLLIEGGYPYVVGGVSSWTHSLIEALPSLRFHVVAIIVSSQSRSLRYNLPENVGLTEIILDRVPVNRRPSKKNNLPADSFAKLFASILTNDDGSNFEVLMAAIDKQPTSSHDCCDSREAWSAMEKINQELLPSAPLLDFFWAWRFLVQSILSISLAPLPHARIYHAVSTGYAGLLGARAKCITGRPFIVTEHGIYANERRIEIAVSEWIYQVGSAGFDVSEHRRELTDLWLEAFGNFSRITYKFADRITTLFEANQFFQVMDGALPEKMMIIRNGIAIRGPHRETLEDVTVRRQHRVLFVGRVVPIKDIRTFILAIDCLRRIVPNFEALIVGPEDEDPEYASECRCLVDQLDLSHYLQFLGGKSNVGEYLSESDVLVLTSISEGQPLVLLEAGAVGLPAVATDVGSCREILEGANDDPQREPGGIIVPPCDPEATADAIARILLNPSLKKSMGLAMRRRVESEYNQNKSAEKYLALYRSLL